MTNLDSQYPPNMIKQLISNAKQWASKFWDIEESATTTLDRRKQTILSNDSNLERDTPGQVVSKISITQPITKLKKRHKNNISNMFNFYLLR